MIEEFLLCAFMEVLKTGPKANIFAPKAGKKEDWP